MIKEQLRSKETMKNIQTYSFKPKKRNVPQITVSREDAFENNSSIQPTRNLAMPMTIINDKSLQYNQQLPLPRIDESQNQTPATKVDIGQEIQLMSDRI